MRLGIAALPRGVGMRHLMPVGLLAGIGFTVSIFITDLAFEDEMLETSGKVGIFVASMMAALAGWIAMRRA